MKKLLKVFLIVSLLFVSCSKDDEQVVPIVNNELTAVKIMQKEYNIDSGQLESILKFYVTKEESKVDFYSSNNQLIATSVSSNKYDSAGNILSSSAFDKDGEKISEVIYSYDNSNRLIEYKTEAYDNIKNSGKYITIQKYTYNPDGTITAVRSIENNGESESSTNTYFVNSEGRIFKEESDHGYGTTTTELIFDANGEVIEVVTTMISEYNGEVIGESVSKIKYTLDDVHFNPDEDFLANSVLNDIFSGNNIILSNFMLNSVGDVFNDKLILKEEHSSLNGLTSFEITYERTFNDIGRILTENKMIDGKLIEESTYSYE